MSTPQTPWQQSLAAAGRHPAVVEIARWFEFEHLPAGQAKTVSRLCRELAEAMTLGLADGPELTTGLRKLLEVKAWVLGGFVQRADGPVGEEPADMAGDDAVRPPLVRSGDIVLYRLREWDADAVNKRRRDWEEYREGSVRGSTGFQAHYGVTVCEGETYPAVVVRTTTPGVVTSAQVMLPGNDTLYVTYVGYGTDPGQWQERA